MYPHHEESLNHLIAYFKDREDIIALIFGGSVAKGTERPDSDLDATVILTDESYDQYRKEGRLAEVIHGHCTYEGGYFDIKYKSKAFFEVAAAVGSEPTRSAYLKSRVLYSKDPDIESLLARVTSFPLDQKEEKRRVFYANLWLNQCYFMYCLRPEDLFMRSHVATEVVYSIYRMILQENEILFPCNRRLEEYVLACDNKPVRLRELVESFLSNVSEATCKELVDSFLAWTTLPIPEDVNAILSTYCRYYEEWWNEEGMPFPNEW